MTTDPSTTTRPRGRKRGVALLLLAVAVVAGSVAASQATTSRELEPPQAVEVPEATSGTAYCPVTAADGDGAVLQLAAVGDADAEVVLTRWADGVGTAEEPQLLPAGTTVTLPVAAEQLGQPVTVDWRGGPVVAQYQLVDGDEVAAAPCATSAAREWHLAGFDTSLGSVSVLHLFNPFGQDALVSLEFGTPEGRVELVIADELLVPHGTSIALNLAQFRPETPDLAVTVRTRAGRVVPQGQVDLGPPAENVEAVTGRALIPAATAVSADALVHQAVADDVTSSWVTVYNPSERSAGVRMQVTTPLGDASALSSETTVPAGGTTRIDLGGLSALPTFGVHLTSLNGVGITATRVAAVQDGDRQGVAVALGAPEASEIWTLVGVSAPDGVVTLYNPADEPTTATLGAVGAGDLDWGAVTVPPNGLVELPVGDVELGGPVLVTAESPIVAGVVNLAEGEATEYWTAGGVRLRELIGGGMALPAQRDPALTTQPAVSATATPTPEAAVDGDVGEGGLGDAEDVEPTPTPTATPTPEITPPVVSTTDPTPTAPPSPSPSASAAPPPSPSEAGASDAPTPTEDASPVATEEGSLFG